MCNLEEARNSGWKRRWNDSTSCGKGEDSLMDWKEERKVKEIPGEGGNMEGGKKQEWRKVQFLRNKVQVK